MKKRKTNKPVDVRKGEVDIWDGLDVWVDYAKAMDKANPECSSYEIIKEIERARAEGRLYGRKEVEERVRAAWLEVSKKQSANGRKGAKERKRQAKTDDGTKKLKMEFFQAYRTKNPFESDRCVCDNFARRKGVKAETVRAWLKQHKAETRGRQNAARDSKCNN